jgi:hypothetical protein
LSVAQTNSADNKTPSIPMVDARPLQAIDERMAELVRQRTALLAALRVTAGNIRSLGPAGALDAIPESYRRWLQVVEDAIASATATTRTDADIEDDHRAIREESEAYE